MKVVILCAGLGTRLNSKKPKGLIKINNKTLLDKCVEGFLSNGIKKKDIFFATGFKRKLIETKFGKKYNYAFNNKFKKTNMVYSLFTALKKITNSDVIITYSDIIYKSSNINKLIKNQYDISTLIDFNWKPMWKKKNKLQEDSESLRIKDKKIIELGKPTTNIRNIDGRYVGIIRFSKKKLKKIKDIYRLSLKINKRKFEKMDMTNFLNFLIQNNFEVHSVKLSGKWNEYDDLVDLNYKYNKI